MQPFCAATSFVHTQGVLVMMFLLAGASRAHAEDIPQKTFAHPDRIRYDGSCMTIDGHDTFIYSAAFHYFRCPEALWRDRAGQKNVLVFGLRQTANGARLRAMEIRPYENAAELR